jgi:hypothetical protein
LDDHFNNADRKLIIENLPAIDAGVEEHLSLAKDEVGGDSSLSNPFHTKTLAIRENAGDF